MERRLGVETDRSQLQLFLLAGPGLRVEAQARGAVLLYAVLRALDAVRNGRAAAAT